MTLKPCPLCGGSVVVEDIPNHLSANGYWRILCWPCDLELQTHYIAPGHVGADKVKMQKLAVKIWNRRAK